MIWMEVKDFEHAKVLLYDLFDYGYKYKFNYDIAVYNTVEVVLKDIEKFFEREVVVEYKDFLFIAKDFLFIVTEEEEKVFSVVTKRLAIDNGVKRIIR